MREPRTFSMPKDPKHEVQKVKNQKYTGKARKAK
jgi:hypothetical protein